MDLALGFTATRPPSRWMSALAWSPSSDAPPLRSPPNIVEGSGRPTRDDYARFLGIAAASLHELHYHLELSKDLGYGDANAGEAMMRETGEIRAMLTALRRKVKPERPPSASPLADY